MIEIGKHEAIANIPLPPYVQKVLDAREKRPFSIYILSAGEQVRTRRKTPRLVVYNDSDFEEQVAVGPVSFDMQALIADVALAGRAIVMRDNDAAVQDHAYETAAAELLKGETEVMIVVETSLAHGDDWINAICRARNFTYSHAKNSAETPS